MSDKIIIGNETDSHINWVSLGEPVTKSFSIPLNSVKKLTQEFDYLGRKFQCEIELDGNEYSIDTMWFFAKVNLGTMSRIETTDEELQLFITEDSDNLFTTIDAALAKEALDNDAN